MRERERGREELYHSNTLPLPIFNFFPCSMRSSTMAMLPFEADLCSGVAPRLSAMFTSASLSSNAMQMDFQFLDAAYCKAEWPSTVIAFTFAPSVSSVLTTFSRPADDARIRGVMFVCERFGRATKCH